MLQEPQKAIHYYTKAQCYSTALKLAKVNMAAPPIGSCDAMHTQECDLQGELMSLALLCSEDDKLEAARYVCLSVCVFV